MVPVMQIQSKPPFQLTVVTAPSKVLFRECSSNPQLTSPYCPQSLAANKEATVNATTVDTKIAYRAQTKLDTSLLSPVRASLQ